MQLALASQRDRDWIWHLYRTCASRDNCCWTDDYPSEEILDTDLANGWLYVACQEGVPCGAVSLLPTDDLESCDLGFAQRENICVLARLGLSPTLQGRGMGSALLLVAEAAARQNGRSAIHLLCDECNKAANTLYCRHGYRTVGTVLLYGHLYLAYEKLLQPSECL